MNRQILGLMITVTILSSSCTKTEQNPFLSEFKTPYGVPPFGEIKTEHFLPAYKAGFEEQNAEIEAIINKKDEPTFENTIAAFDASGKTLQRVSAVLGNLVSANTSPELANIDKETAPLMSQHNDNIFMNPKLFERVKKVYENRDNSGLNTEQKMLLEFIYKQFERGGANLEGDAKIRMSEINKELSLLEIKFKENVLAENNAFKLVIDNEDDLAGLPNAVREAALETGKQSGDNGKWVFNLSNPSRTPFLTYSEKRNLREKVYNAYINLGDNNNENDNKEVALKIMALRYERSNLLGYKTHAEFVLDNRMAKTPEVVFDLCNQLMDKATVAAKKEIVEMQRIIDAEKGGFKLKPWDWFYYSEKVKKNKFDLTDEELRPYFPLSSSLNGVFDVCKKLFGMEFKLRTDIPKYHEDASVYEVFDADSKETLGILYLDFHPRQSKRSGAWMSSYRKQYNNAKGERVPPVITVVCNFTKPTETLPALLSYREVETLFHEFGHAIHGLLSRCQYYTISGTATPRDFVELPSSIMENWAGEPEVLKTYALHWETNQPIPDELIEKLEASSKFNQGFITSEFMAAALLDMYWYTLETSEIPDVVEFENQIRKKIGLVPEIEYRYRTTYFQHIFNLAYSAGYYSYTWSEILDADAFQLFKEKGIFDAQTAKSFKTNILEKGGSEDAMTMFVNFRGRQPVIDALLNRKGI